MTAVKATTQKLVETIMHRMSGQHYEVTFNEDYRVVAKHRKADITVMFDTDMGDEHRWYVCYNFHGKTEEGFIQFKVSHTATQMAFAFDMLTLALHNNDWTKAFNMINAYTCLEYMTYEADMHYIATMTYIDGAAITVRTEDEDIDFDAERPGIKIETQYRTMFFNVGSPEEGFVAAEVYRDNDVEITTTMLPYGYDTDDFVAFAQCVLLMCGLHDSGVSANYEF